ncbi:MAG: hypothetical protein U5P41_15565 [Gammaproteobacteria bacterium]|nr:hypothetical protein [Gammaproteobacteria bacterium]
MPIEGVPKKHEWLYRCNSEKELKNNKGTVLHIPAFKVAENWEYILAASVIENFFGAICSGKLEVNINSIYMNKENIGTHFYDHNLRSSILEMHNQPDYFDHALAYYKTFSNENEAQIAEHENRELGNFKIKILVAEELPKRVAVLRNGMFITDSTPRT